MASETDEPVPVTVVSGSLGAGKTTLVNHVLKEVQDSGETITVLVNDMGKLNVDAELVEGPVSGEDGDLVELSGGCICCQLQGELRRRTAELAREHDFDYLLVESSGVSEPTPVAQNFVSGSGLYPGPYELDTMATVVDTDIFDGVIGDTGMDAAELGADATGATKPIEDILMDQIEFSDVLILNKCDLLSEEEVDRVEAVLRELKPDAAVHRTEFGIVEPGKILGTGRFDIEETGNSAGWIERLKSEDSVKIHHEGDDGHEDGHEHGHEHRHPDEKYGVSSFVYRRDRPFHPRRLTDFLEDMPDSVVRAKGFVWLPHSEKFSVSLNVAANEYRLSVAGKWIAELPDEKREEMLNENPVLRENWDPNWGDRGEQLVFIGTEMESEDVVNELDDCLLTDEEMGSDWDDLENPVDILPF
ncbi:GTP-binding protein [Haladaptatus sp. F3-133]|jgi:G3E family GTPase|uniref:GTP-binding protein n=1 Tax=Halorutilus salinus TaxID=2487751 RepID=A0A9Q4C2M0_9EURY|nr:GTP-binding protein [Halorutilus salinus]MCX2818727.1 GTP-binding protein [Halorutilus salinus]